MTGKKGLGRKQTVLIVEDDKESALLLKTLFKRKGYEVVGTATNGNQAYTFYKEKRPDIVTMDIMMPSVDGRTSTKKILEFDPHAKIIVVSVLGHDELDTLKTLGVRAFIKKPIDIEELFEAVINIQVSVLKDEKGVEMGAVGMASTIEGITLSPGLFIDILRHDILNPLGLIRNFAELMSDDAPKPLKSQVEAIIRNVDRLIEIVEDASRLSSLERSKRMDAEDLELSGLIKQSLEELSPAIIEKKIVIDSQVKPGFKFKGNKTFSYVTTNLLSNAIKFSKPGAKVILQAKRKDDKITFKVIDYGPGVLDEHKESIFKRFERPKKEGVKGTGLGLTIVKKVVELHNGTVWVEDNPDGGSIFKVMIPIRGVGG